MVDKTCESTRFRQFHLNLKLSVNLHELDFRRIASARDRQQGEFVEALNEGKIRKDRTEMCRVAFHENWNNSSDAAVEGDGHLRVKFQTAGDFCLDEARDKIARCVDVSETPKIVDLNFESRRARDDLLGWATNQAVVVTKGIGIDASFASSEYRSTAYSVASRTPSAT